MIIGTSWVNGSLSSIQQYHQGKKEKRSKQIVHEQRIIGLSRKVVGLCVEIAAYADQQRQSAFGKAAVSQI